MSQNKDDIDLTYEVTKDGENYYIMFSWDSAGKYTYYNFYFGNPDDGKLILHQGLSPMDINYLKHEIGTEFADTAWVAVQPITKDGKKMDIQDTVSILLPSTKLPRPILTTAIERSQNQVALSWVQKPLEDIKETIVYINGKKIATLKGNNNTTYITETLDPGKYTFSLRYITHHGFKSDYSNEKELTIR